MPIHNNTGMRIRIKKHPLYMRIIVNDKDSYYTSMYTGYTPHSVDIHDNYLRVRHTAEKRTDIVRTVRPPISN